MDIEYALIADFAEIVSGKLYLMGGGWDAFALPNLPGQIRVAVAAGIRIGWEETNRVLPVTITVEDDDGRELARLEAGVNAGRPTNVPPGTGQLAQIAANLVIQLDHRGGHRVVLTAGDQRRNLPFRVNEGR